MIIFILCVVGFLVFGVALLATGSNQQEEAAQADAAKVRSLSIIEGFSPAIIYPGVLGEYGVAIDPTSERFAIAVPNGNPRAYDFAQLISVEVERNGETLTTTNGKINTKGAALGTLLAGPVGGLMAGAKTSSTSHSVTTITALTLKLYVNDLNVPCFAIPFLGFGASWGEGSINRAKAMKEIDAWYGRFRTIVASNSKQSGTRAQQVTFAVSEPLPVAPQVGWLGRTFGA